jgi:hypothetical protein
MENKTVKSVRKVKEKPEFVYNLEVSDNHNYFIEGTLLHNSPNVILDEAALIDDDVESKIFRMLGDQMDNFYMKVGNPFRRNHFLKDCLNPKYYKINADWQVGLKEGRLTEDFLEEARKKPHFDVLYGNKFPDANAIDDKGWSNLLTDKEYENCLTTIEDESLFGNRLLGVDVARGGGNYNVWCLRTDNYAKILAKNSDGDLMSVVGTTIRLAKEHKVAAGNIFVDDTGVGAGVTDRLREQGMQPKAVKLGAMPIDTGKFMNKRAELHWKMKLWLASGRLNSENDWSDLLNLRYKADSNGRLKIMSKEDMASHGWESPDASDSLMLTFAVGSGKAKVKNNYVSVNKTTGY